MAVKDWIGSPDSWGEWGWKATSWFNELATATRDLLVRLGVLEGVVVVSGDDVNLVAPGTNGSTGVAKLDGDESHLVHWDGNSQRSWRVMESPVAADRTALVAAGTYEWHVASGAPAGTSRRSIHSSTDSIYYQDNGATEMLRLEHDTGVVKVANMEGGALTLAPGVSDYGSSYALPRGRMSAGRVVVLEGLLRNTSGGTIAGGTAIAQVASSRLYPQSRRIFAVMTSAGVARLDVNTSGQILLSVGLANGGWVSVSGISYVGGF